MLWPLSDELDRLNDRAELNSLQSVEEVPATFSETFQASLDHVLNEERSDSANRAWRPQLEARSQAIEKVGGDINLARKYELKGLSWFAKVGHMVENLGPGVTRNRLSDETDVDAYLQQRALERTWPDQVLSDDRLRAVVSQELGEQRNENQAIMARGGGFAQFLGAGAGLVSDPLVLMTLPFGIGSQVGRGVLMNAARGAAGEGAIALAVEVPIQLEVMRFKDEIDSPWSYTDAAYNVIAASVGAGVIRGAGSMTVDVASEALAKYRGGKAVNRTAETEAAAEVLQRFIELERESPYAALQRNLGAEDIEPGVDFFMGHAEAAVKARAQFEAGDAIDVANIARPSEEVIGRNPVDRAASQFTVENVAVFAPENLQVDARRFQFKEGGDTEGVTKSLAEVDKFDPALAGQVLVWEDTAGASWIVDGHQRRGLALRAQQAGQDPAEVQLSGFIVREADGVTAEDAMRIGAVRNLTASTGSALDAAKVLRGIGPAGELLLPPLPPNSALLRQGRFIARLGDDAFNAVVNDIVPARQAAIVGELIPGDPEQLATLGALQRLKPANEVQARAMVEQIRAAGFQRATTEDLFGERSFAETLIRERAQVLDSALKQARQDRATFNRLVSRGTEIESTGANRLDQAANTTRVQESAEAIETLTRLANQKGPISDALNQAAQDVKGGAQPAAAAKSVLEAVKREGGLSDTGGRQADAVRPASVDEQPGGAGFVFERGRGLTPEQQAIEQRFMEQLEATPWEDLKAQYATFEEAHGGKVLSVDAARELSPDYLADRTVSAAVHEPSSSFIKRLYAERLGDAPAAGEMPTVLFTAGGTGAGKTTGLKVMGDAERNQLIFDGNLAKAPSGIRKMDQALAAGKNVTILYVYRDPIEAFRNGALKRAMRQAAQFGSGRTVPIDAHISTHAGSNQALRELAEHYADEPRVRISVVDNSNGKGQAALIDVERLPEVDAEALRPRLEAEIEEALAHGEITEDIAAGFRGIPEAARSEQPGVSGQPEPVDGGGAAGTQGGGTGARELVDLPDVPGRGIPDEGGATGYIADDVYDDALAQFELLEADAGMLELSRLSVDDTGEQQLEIIGARRALDELDTTEDALADIDICVRGGA